MNIDFKTKTSLSLLTLIVASTYAHSSSFTLSSERLRFYQAIRSIKPTVSCGYTLPSSQDAVITIFPQGAAQPMLILKGHQTVLFMNSAQGPRIVGAVQSSSTVQGPEFIRSLFRGQHRVICGVFEIPGSVWKTPMTYYAIDPRQGEVLSGVLSQQGKFTKVGTSMYEDGGLPFQLLKLPNE